MIPLSNKPIIEIDQLLRQSNSFHPDYEQPIRPLDIFYEDKTANDSFDVFTYRGSEYQMKKIKR